MLTGPSLALLGGLALGVTGAPSQLLAGLPLSTVGLLVAAGVVYASLALPRPSWSVARWLLLGFALVIGLKLAAASVAPPIGLKAAYWPRTTPAGAPEPSTDYPWLIDATRIERSLDLRGEEFAVHFFNDASRFNFGADVQLARDQLPFSVRFSGFLEVPSGGERRFVIESSGPAQVWIDDGLIAADDARVSLAAGLHALRVDYARAEARVPRLRILWERTTGSPLEPLGGTDVRWQPNANPAGLGSILGGVADAAMVLLVAGWLVLGLAKARAAHTLTLAGLGALPLLFLVHGMLLYAPLAGRATILSGLDDWLIYESSARDILLNGLLMNGGQAHAPPFYGQPLYPYVLALAHRVSGESLFGPLALQYAGLGGVLALTAVPARRAFGSRLDGLVALACLWLLMQLEAEHFKIARQLFTEDVYMPLVLASLVVVVGMARRSEPPSWRRAALAGGLLGLTAISRSQFLLFVPFGLLIVLRAWRSDIRARMVSLATVLIGLVLVIAPVTARNWLVSGQLVSISSSGSASLLEFHRPPPGLIDQAALQKAALFEALHLDTQTRTVLAFARADPRGYLGTLLPLGAHSVGLQGRNDAGIYWPLLITSLLYLASFGLKQTRRLHVWPIHAFVATHLLVLMLFEADTYGYRLVMPMYAPMVAVAGQVALAAMGYALRVTRYAFSATRNAQRATRYAQLGWSLVAMGALLWQAKSVVDIWPQREAALHGLAGPAALAAATADQVGADAVYVASIDGTPRRFGAGSLTGMRYPWFKWFDPARSVPLPPESGSAVYMLSELNGHTLAGDVVECLTSQSADPSSLISTPVVAGVEARRRCLAAGADGRPPVVFDGLATVNALRVSPSTEAGEPLEAWLVWQPLVAHPEPHQFSLQLDDPQAGDGTLWGNGTLDLYPARQWEPGEALLSRLPLATDPTAIPQLYRLTLGLAPTRANAAPASSVWQGAPTDRVPVGSVALTPGSSRAGQALPADMRAVEGPPLVGGGLELIATRPLPAEAAIGGPLRIGLLWRAMQDAPPAAEFKLRLVRENGEIVQESVLTVLGGRMTSAALRGGNVVRDEQTFLISGRVPPERLSVDVSVLGERVRLGTITMTGRAHQFDPSPAAAVDRNKTFGSAIELLGDKLEPAQARPSQTVSVKLRWRAAAEMAQAYKMFVHMLDPAGERVVAQRDAEPLDGRAPTTGWVVGEVIDDEYAITLPAGLVAADYPVEVGVYDARSGDRLQLADGQNRLVLDQRVRVTP